MARLFRAEGTGCGLRFQMAQSEGAQRAAGAAKELAARADRNAVQHGAS
jgi:hypothetical protein